ALAERRELARVPVGIRCAATKKIRGLRNSIGYLMLDQDGWTFVAKRFFSFRVYEIRSAEIHFAEIKRGIFMHRLVLRTPSAEHAFYLFKNTDVREPVTAPAHPIIPTALASP